MSLRERVLQHLSENRWQWQSYNEVSKAIGKSQDWGKVLAELLYLARAEDQQVVGRKSKDGSRRIALHEFRWQPKALPMLGQERTAVERLVCYASWMVSIVRNAKAPMSRRRVVAMLHELRGQLNDKEAFAVLRIVEEKGVLIGSQDGGLKYNNPTPELKKSVESALRELAIECLAKDRQRQALRRGTSTRLASVGDVWGTTPKSVGDSVGDTNFVEPVPHGQIGSR